MSTDARHDALTAATPDFTDLLVRLAHGSLAVAAVWGGVVLVCVLVEALTDGRLRLARFTGCPPIWRTWLLGLCVVLLATLASPANAAEPPRPTTHGDLDGLALPDRPTSSPARIDTEVLVRRGDTLWAIARGQLRRSADTREVARAVTDLHERNRDVMGADPDLILPGQRLQLPDSFPTMQHPPQPQEKR